MGSSTVNDEISSQKLSESSQYWKQLFGHAYLYRNNPEDAACPNFPLHHVPAFDVPFKPIEKFTPQQMGSPRLGPPPSSTFPEPPGVLYAKGSAEWRVVSTGADPVVDARSEIYMLLGISSKTIEEVKLDNDFPASPPRISTTSSTDEIIRRCTSLGIGSAEVKFARDALDDSKDNHLAALTFAWTYILSALWGESQGGRIQFLDVGPEARELPGEGHQIVYVPGEEGGAVNWWRQLLAQPSGWKVTMEYRETEYHSPWSIRMLGDINFRVLSRAPAKARALEPPDASTALEYLAQYCSFYGLTKQAETALAAALVLPSHILCPGARVQVNLPKPVHAVDVIAVGSGDRSQHLNSESPLLRLLPQLPQLMTISASGITRLLLGAFYNPEVPSTLCGEWYIPAIRAWPESPSHAAAIGCLRSPCLSRWWIGAGATSFVLPRMIRMLYSMWHTDLHLALWTGSSSLFPHSQFCRMLTDDGITLRTTTENDIRLVLRADEVLVAFLNSATGPHQKMFLTMPPAPFHPPGYAELDKSSFQIIRVADAGFTLRLQYVNCAWEIRGDAAKKPTSNPVTEAATSFSFSVPSPDAVPEWEMPAVETLVGRAQETSENITRSIMDWICGYRGIEADQDRGDLDVERLFASDDE
ncbi:hypothetical protein RUND412_004769 [Rhizina undulata]